MPSIIPGYEYDIFISYRQKDNKGDKWVSQFVADLKGELEATFKEDISIYFDVNPHDGLLEIHNVSKSLEGKLKTLLFIPIISQTYCDPNCFAWQHEFCVFNKMAREDSFGLDVKLRGGNVASRILPVKINDLDPEDNELLEKELGGFLRAIEFIYKEPGVNRPLTPGDDHKTNLNRTSYRNQINKVALAIKEIITILKKPVLNGDLPAKAVEAASASVSVVELEKSIAVLPFINDSSDQENTYFINGVMEEILNNLQRIKDLRVISRTSVEKFRGQNKSIPEIAQELGVNYIVEGSGQKYGNAFRLRVQLIMAAKESHLWGESFQQKITEVEDIFTIQTQIAESIASELNAVISPEEKQRIEKVPSINLAVYEQYLKARSYYGDFSRQSLNKALEFLNSGVEKSPNWAPLYVGLTEVWFTIQGCGYEPPSVTGPKIMENLYKAMELDTDLSDVHYLKALIAFMVEWDWKKSEEEFLKALAINPNHSSSRIYYSFLLAGILQRYDEALAQGELAYSLDPLNPNTKAGYAFTLIAAGDFKSGLSLAEEVVANDPGNIVAHSIIVVVASRFKDYEKLLRSDRYLLQLVIPVEQDFFDEIHSIFRESGIVSAYEIILSHLEKFAENNYIQFLEMVYRYIIAEQPDKAMDWIEKGYELHDPQMAYISSKAYYLDPLFNNPRFIAMCEKMNLPIPKTL
jgi:TolB-like protein